MPLGSGGCNRRTLPAHRSIHQLSMCHSCRVHGDAGDTCQRVSVTATSNGINSEVITAELSLRQSMFVW